MTDVHETETPERFAFAIERQSELLASPNTFIEKNARHYPTVPPASEWSDYQI